jgi:hypothetical protein
MTAIGYPSPKWLEESAKIYRANPAVQKELEKVTVKIAFRIKAEPAWGIEKDLLFWTVVEKGQLKELSFLSDAAAKRDAQYIMAATPQEWKKILRKEVKVLSELMLRKIVLEQGSMTEALALMPHAPTLVDVLTKAELRFPDEMSPEELAAHRKAIEDFRAGQGV